MNKRVYDVLGVFGIFQGTINAVIFPALMAVAFGPVWLLLYLFYFFSFVVFCAVMVNAKDEEKEATRNKEER